MMTQEEALAVMESGLPVLLTGAAGAGKTYVLSQFIRRARKRGKSVAVTATTGLAATHLNGTTIHSWAGIGIQDEFTKHTVDKLSKGRQDIIKKADILVIDEISMLHDFRLDMVDTALRLVRDNEEPFGGVQVVLSGDFYQLPPVNRRGERQGSFVTNSQIWLQNVFSVCYLHTQFRQIDDPVYTDILNGIRAGVLTRNQLQLLQDRADQEVDQSLSETRLLTVNVDVDEINRRHLEQLEGDVHEYVMETHGGKQYVEQLQRSCLAPQLLRLRVGARVMCIKNAADRKYANGSLGIVVGFEQPNAYPVISLLNGREVTMQPESWELMDGDKRRASIVQIPLRLAWAITVHKSQGMTLDAARIDLSRAFVEGMGYVALSRVRSLAYLRLDGLNGMALRVSAVARQLDVQLREKSNETLEALSDRIEAWRQAEAQGDNERSVSTSQDILPVHPELFESLRDWRAKKASAQHIPPYMIAHDKALRAVAAMQPQDAQALLEVPGFGHAKVDKYGQELCDIVRGIVGKDSHA